MWKSVAYGNGRFVAVSSTGAKRAMTSDDGIDWQMRDVTVGAWTSVTFGNGLFVAVGAEVEAHVMTSPDGITWTLRPAPRGGWSAVTYGGGVFVAVSANNEVSGIAGATPWAMTSPNGIDWTARAVTDDQRWSAITYGNGRFVAVGDAGPSTTVSTSTHRVMTSTDGVAWASVSASSGAPADGTWTSVTYGVGSDNVGRFVAVAYSGTNRVMTSTDGLTWTVLQDTASKTVADGILWYSVTYGSGIFMAVAFNSTKVMTSTDGLIWTASESTPSQANVWTGVVNVGDVFVAVAETGNDRVKRFGPNVPAKPTASGLTCSNAITSLTVSLSSDGGSPITNYEYHIATAHPGAAPTTWQPFSPAQTTSPLQWDMKALGFDPGVQHHFYVRAVNAMGPSPSSWVSGSQSSCANNFTVDPPPAPTAVTVSAEPGGITSDNTPTVSVSDALHGHTVTVSAQLNGITVSCTYVASSTETGCDLGPLTDGVWSITTTQTSSKGITSSPSAPTSLTVDTTPPTVVSAAINATGNEMTVTFDEVLGATTADLSDFVVMVDGVAATLAAVVVSGNSVIFTLATPVAAGQVVSISYVAPAASSTSSNAAVQDLAGNDALGFTTSATVPNASSNITSPGSASPGTTSPGSGTPETAPGDVSPGPGELRPVPTADGALPQLTPGEHQVFENGQRIPVTQRVVNGNQLALRGPDFELVLSGDCSGSACSILVDETGRETLVLELDGKARVAGFGFLPGSLVHVWIFSEPVYLGALAVAGDGTFDGDVQLNGVPVGQHTLQVNGISFDGVDRTADLGVLVVASPPQLPTTGAELWEFLLLAVLLLLLGLLVISGHRRDSLHNWGSPTFSEFWGDEDSG
jgi:hypothetical protein